MSHLKLPTLPLRLSTWCRETAPPFSGSSPTFLSMVSSIEVNITSLSTYSSYVTSWAIHTSLKLRWVEFCYGEWGLVSRLDMVSWRLRNSRLITLTFWSKSRIEEGLKGLHRYLISRISLHSQPSIIETSLITILSIQFYLNFYHFGLPFWTTVLKSARISVK